MGEGVADGAELAGWTPRPHPQRTVMEGRVARLEPFEPDEHAAGLHAAYSEDVEGVLWAYRAEGPFPDAAAFRAYAERAMCGDDPLFHVIRSRATGEILGAAAFMRITPAHGVIEVGTVSFSPRLRRSTIATEAMYLMARRAFDELGYRRYEWKCDARNLASRAAAARLGFRFEGTFRQHMVQRGRNRDTCWFSIIDTEWPAVKAAFEAWLDPSNFDGENRQIASLASFR